MITKEKLGLPWVADSFNIFDDSGEIVMDRGCRSFADTEDFIIKAVNNHHDLTDQIKVLTDKIKRVENCLVCACIGDPLEVVDNALQIIKEA